MYKKKLRNQVRLIQNLRFEQSTNYGAEVVVVKAYSSSTSTNSRTVISITELRLFPIDVQQ